MEKEDFDYVNFLRNSTAHKHRKKSKRKIKKELKKEYLMLAIYCNTWTEKELEEIKKIYSCKRK